MLGEIPLDAEVREPLGGINPYSDLFDLIGKQFLQLFIQHGGLTQKSRVLEIGCGTGRISKQLQGFIDGGSYTGFDINRRFIEYCRDSYNNNMKFDLFDIQHDEYNKDGSTMASDFTFPYKNRSFDFICSVAVFNHLKFDWAANYIRESIRLLTPGGVFFSTFILLNQRSMEAIDSKEEHPFKFQRRDHDTWYDYKSRPLWNTALPETPLRRIFVKGKMMIQEPIRYGEWCGSSAAITGHDVIIAKKI